MVAVLGMAGILSGSIDLGNGNVYELGGYAALIGWVTLLGGTALADRGFDSFEMWELATIGVTVLLIGATYFGQPVAFIDFMEGSHPWSSLGVAAVSYLGYWVAVFRRP